MKVLSNRTSFALITSTILSLTLCNPTQAASFSANSVLNLEKAAQDYSRLDNPAQLSDRQPVPPTKGGPGGSR